MTDLVKAMHEKGANLSEDLIAFILKEVLSGLSYLHSQHCMHRDVKGQNCMLTAQGHVKLVDFGELCLRVVYVCVQLSSMLTS